MGLRDQYDWVVLGDHPGALLSAGLIAKQGLSVLVLPITPSHLTHVSKSGQCLDPESNFLIGLGKVDRGSGLLAQCLNHLGVPTSASPLIQRGDLFLPQVLTPSSRLWLAMEDEKLLMELGREMGTDLARGIGLVGALDSAESTAISFWRQYPERLLERHEDAQGKKKSLPFSRDKVLQDLRVEILKNRPRGRGTRSRFWFTADGRVGDIEGQFSHLDVRTFSEICAGLWFATTSVDSTDPLVMDFVHSLSLARTGASFKGGLTAYRQFLLKLLRHLGVQVLDQSQCRRIFVEDQKLMGVQIAQKGKMISVRGGALGVSLDHIQDFLIYSGKKDEKDFPQVPRPTGWKFTVALTIHEEAVPPGMGARAVWYEEGAPAIEIELGDPDDYQMGHQSGQRLLFLRTTLPFSQQSLDVEYQRMISARMFKQLTEIFPFIEYHIVRVYPDFRMKDSFHLGEFSEAYGFVSPEMIPSNLRVYDDASMGDGMGSRSAIDGLYVISEESYPALGSFGGVISGIEAVTHFVQNSGLSGGQRLKEFWGFLDQ